LLKAGFYGKILVKISMERFIFQFPRPLNIIASNQKIKKGGNTMTHKFEVDREFMRLIPPLSEDEYKLLEQDILSRGKILNPILLWDDCTML